MGADLPKYIAELEFDEVVGGGETVFGGDLRPLGGPCAFGGLDRILMLRGTMAVDRFL